MGRYEDIIKRTEWFRADRFGMFIHYGLYSVCARHEWIKNQERMTDEDYQKYFDNFTAENYNPKEWARVAKEAGMKYAVLTTKHHEGFCLFDSQYTDYKATNTKAGRDLVKEFVDAFRAEGLKVGFYYSLLDWHHPDYPHMSDSIHPQRGNDKYPDDNRDFSRYVTYLHNQVRELMTNYGKIDVLWFDFSYDDMSGEKWEATKLVKMVRSLQPDVIIDNRLLINSYENISYESEINGDFYSPEQYAPNKVIVEKSGKPFPWELCLTTQANSWGYVANVSSFMSAHDIIRTLVDCVSKNGNLLLNVGPDGKGAFPPQVIEIFKEVGKWMKLNGESIYGCGPAPYAHPDWGRYTIKDNKLYVHIFDKIGYGLQLKDIKPEMIESILRLADNSEVTRFWGGTIDGDMAIDLLCAQLPDLNDTVIKVTLKK